VCDCRQYSAQTSHHIVTSRKSGQRRKTASLVTAMSSSKKVVAVKRQLNQLKKILKDPKYISPEDINSLETFLKSWNAGKPIIPSAAKQEKLSEKCRIVEKALHELYSVIEAGKCPSIKTNDFHQALSVIKADASYEMEAHLGLIQSVKVMESCVDSTHAVLLLSKAWIGLAFRNHKDRFGIASTSNTFRYSKSQINKYIAHAGLIDKYNCLCFLSCDFTFINENINLFYQAIEQNDSYVIKFSEVIPSILNCNVQWADGS
jgi:hypothetical protein